MGQRQTDLCGSMGWGVPGMDHVAAPLRERRGEQTQNSCTGKGQSLGSWACSGRSSGGRAGRPGPCLLSTPLPFLQVSPSDSTLKREFSLDLVAMATLLTKSSFGGGGWLTQKLRGLGEGVPVLRGLLTAPVSPPPRLPQRQGHFPRPSLPVGLSGPLVLRPFPCERHEVSGFHLGVA